MKYMLAFLLLFALTFTALAATDVTGKWNATTQSPDGQTMQLVFTLKQDGNKVTGTVTGPMGDMPISEGTIDGDNISFTVATDQFKVVHKGTVSGDEMKLTADMGDQKFQMTAKREKP